MRQSGEGESRRPDRRIKKIPGSQDSDARTPARRHRRHAARSARIAGKGSTTRTAQSKSELGRVARSIGRFDWCRCTISGAQTVRRRDEPAPGRPGTTQGGGGVINTAPPRSSLLAASVRLAAAIRCVMRVTITIAARDRASGTSALGAWSSLGRPPVHAHLL